VVLGLAARDAAAARDDLEVVRDQASLDAVRQPGELLERVEEAAGRLSSAEQRARSWMVAPWRVLPVAGRQVHSFARLADASSEALQSLANVVSHAHHLVEDADVSADARVSTLTSISEVAEGAVALLDGLDLGPDSGLIGPLATARQRLMVELDDVRLLLSDAHEASRAAATMLDGPGRYLVLAANNAQMHSGAGMFLSLGVLDVGDGSLGISELSPMTDLPLPEQPVELDADLVDRWAYAFDPNEDWRHLGMSPRFDVSGRIAADMWQAATGDRIDGVLALDVMAIALLMEVTGPVDLHGKWLQPGEVLDELLIDQYSALDHPDEQFLENLARRERLGELARAVVTRIDAGDIDALDLAFALVDAAAGRHLTLWAQDERAQRAWSRIGVSGELEPADLLVSIVNRGGNKLDPYLRVTATPQFDPSHSMVTVEVTVRNEAPPGLPAYVAGPYPGTDLEAGEYLGVLTLTAGELCTTPVVLGAPHAVQGSDGPTGVAGTWIRVAPGDVVTHTFELRVADGIDHLTIAPSARIPATVWRLDDRGVDDARRVEWWLS
jgi:hypothetical protein